MLSSVVFKAQWQIICFDKNNEQSGKMILRAETEIGKEGWKHAGFFKKKNWRVYKIQSTGVRPRSREELEAKGLIRLSSVSLSFFILAPNLSFNCSRSWPTQKLRAVLQPTSQEKNCNIDII